MNLSRNSQQLLSPAQLKKLKEHKYAVTNTSLLDPFLQPWWNWLVTKVPIWLAPNLITIVGLAVNILTSLLVIYYSPDCQSEVPGWASILCSLGLFIYQSLDAIDGKQARRTNSSSPLGELFDHGCDSISTVFVSLAICVSLQLGACPKVMFLQCFSAITLFYTAHWQTYVSGTLKFGTIDVTEAQMCIIFLHLISGYFGSGIWTKTEVLGVPLGAIPTLACLPVAIWSLVQTLKVIITGGIGKNGSSVAGTSVFSPVIPFGMVLVPAVLIAKGGDIYRDAPAMYILMFGLVAAKVTNRLVVAHMTKSKMDYLDRSMFGPLLMFINQYFNFIISEQYLLYLSLVWVFLDLWHYCSQVCLEICNSLDIHLFKIKVK